MKRLFWAPRERYVIPLCVAMFIWINGWVRASVIYSQVGSSAPFSAFSSNDQGNPTDQKIADNFLLSESGPTTIRSLRIIGGYGLNSALPSTPPAGPIDNLRILFFTDSAGVPGPILPGGVFNIGVPSQRSTTGGPLLNGGYTPFEYLIDLGAGITLSSGNVYWVSVVNNPGTNYFWDWARTIGVIDQRVASTNSDVLSGPWGVFPNEGGMYFELSDSNIPEPDSLAIILTAAYGALQLRLGRSSKCLLRVRSAT